MIIDAYIGAETDKKLVILGNIDKENGYYQKVLGKYSSHPRFKNVVFPGAIYDKSMLLSLRKECYAYIHGHSVGGTNPGLLEAMAVTDLNFLYGCVFNKEVGQDNALYFDNASELAVLLDKSIDVDLIRKLGTGAKKRMREAYRWEDVASAYCDIFHAGVSGNGN